MNPSSRFLAALRQTVVRLLPEDMLERRRVKLRAEVFRKAGVVFVHVPRSAGTSVTDVVFGRFIGHFRIEQVLKCSPPDILQLPRFTIMRNPWDRAVSAYEFARAGGGVGGERMIRIARPELYAGPEFSSFERFVKAFLAQKDLCRIDGVFRPQVYYAADSAGNLPFDHVGVFEKIEQTEQWLADTLGRPISFPRYNATKRTAYRQYYDAELRNIVGDLYASDVKAIGAEF
jgi:chondroitin 4-sulfotransferase 11